MNTKPIRVLIVDDEPSARASLAVLVSTQPDVVVLETCEDGRSAVEAIYRQQPDLVLLDIQMPELDGFGVIKALSDKGVSLPVFIFITAYDQYAIKAFEVNAIDYLLKPYDDERFYRSLDKARQNLNAIQVQDSAIKLERLIHQLNLQYNPVNAPIIYLKKLAIKQNGKVQFVSTEEINYVESESNFVKVFTQNGMRIASYSCKQLEEMLDPKRFVRIHKSYLVNIDKIDSVEPHFHGDYFIYLKNGSQLKLSRNYKDKLDLIMNQY